MLNYKLYFLDCIVEQFYRGTQFELRKRRLKIKLLLGIL